MSNKLFYIIVLLSSCAPKSFLQKNSHLIGRQNTIRTDGVYYKESIVRRESATVFQGIPYIKFYGEGNWVMGITMDIDALKEKDFEGLLSAKEKSNSNFLVRNDTLFIELFSGYNSFWLFEVYKIKSPDTLIYIGDTRKMGKKINSPPNPWMLQFQKFGL